MAARDAHLQPPVHQLLIYPVAGTDTDTPSYIADENAIPLGRDDVLWYVKNTIASPADLQDPRLDLIGKADLHNLPPTTIISAEIDPLESDGTFLTYKLQAQGVTVDRIEYGGTTHEFFGMGAAVARAKDAETFAAQALDATFDKIGNPRRRPPRVPPTSGARPPAATRHSGVTTRRAVMNDIVDLSALAALYGTPQAPSLVKVTDHITPHYRAFIEASPFVALSTVGPEGADCSPRGDSAGFVRVADPHTLQMPDRRGNNRCDSLRNIVVDGRVGLLFLVPGSGTTLRVNGTARLSADPALCASFAVGEAAPRSVMVMAVQAVYFQCARAIVRADLWNAERHVDPKTLPTPGAILAALSDDAVGGPNYDRIWPERARQTMW